MSSNIRPRDKTSATERQREQRERERRSFHSPIHRERHLTNQMANRYVRNNNYPSPSSRGFPPRSPESTGSRQWNQYPLLSKTLTVANLPPEYAPKDLFDLFSEHGKAEGAFVYAFPDATGRRVGEVAMATYLFAQKVSHSAHISQLGS